MSIIPDNDIIERILMPNRIGPGRPPESDHHTRFHNHKTKTKTGHDRMMREIKNVMKERLLPQGEAQLTPRKLTDYAIRPLIGDAVSRATLLSLRPVKGRGLSRLFTRMANAISTKLQKLVMPGDMRDAERALKQFRLALASGASAKSLQAEYKAITRLLSNLRPEHQRHYDEMLQIWQALDHMKLAFKLKEMENSTMNAYAVRAELQSILDPQSLHMHRDCHLDPVVWKQVERLLKSLEHESRLSQ